MRSILDGLAIITLVLLSHSASADNQLLTPQTPIQVGVGAHFDFMGFDPEFHRVLACHPGAKQLLVLDTNTNAVTNVDTGAVNGLGIDGPDNEYFTAGANQSVAVIDRATLKKVADIPLSGNGDDVVYDPKNGMVYVDHDDGTDMWVIDPKTNKISGTITVGGVPEVLVYDSITDRLYQNIKTTDQIQAIDPASNAVVSTWSTTPAHSPHGLALDSDKGWLFTAGKNSKLAVVDVKSGKMVASCDIAAGVDEIAYNSAAGIVYCGCSGFVSVVQVTGTGVTNIGDVPVSKGGHSVAVDPSSHDVWIDYSTDTGSYLQELRQTKTASK